MRVVGNAIRPGRAAGDGTAADEAGRVGEASPRDTEDVAALVAVLYISPEQPRSWQAPEELVVADAESWVRCWPHIWQGGRRGDEVGDRPCAQPKE